MRESAGWMMSVLLMTASVWAAEPTSAPEGAWQISPVGQTLIVPMTSAPYPHATRADGWKIRDKVYPRDPHYVDSSVGLFIPRGYRARESVDLLIYFHGHLNNVRQALDTFRLREQIAAAGKNVIAVFPEGPKDSEDSGGGKLEEKGGLRRLVEEVLDRLAADGKVSSRRPGRILLAGHSGAYRVISFCLERGGLDANVSDVCLLDATYDRLDAFADWAAAHREGRLFSIFTDHLAGENVYLMTHLRQRGVAHELVAEQDVVDATMQSARILFLYAEKLKHNDTARWLQRWLAGTSLPALQ